MQRLANTPAFFERNLIIKGADLATQQGWTGVPNFILVNKDISVGAKLTYALLLKYAREQNECFPGQERLATDMGTSRQSVNTYIRQLREAELVDVKRRGQGRSNLYTIYIKASFWRKHSRR